jgi:hypothetical protein
MSGQSTPNSTVPPCATAARNADSEHVVSTVGDAARPVATSTDICAATTTVATIHKPQLFPAHTALLLPLEVSANMRDERAYSLFERAQPLRARAAKDQAARRCDGDGTSVDLTVTPLSQSAEQRALLLPGHLADVITAQTGPASEPGQALKAIEKRLGVLTLVGDTPWHRRHKNRVT